jgi:predicted phosphatase
VKVIKSNNITVFDIDDTLLMHIDRRVRTKDKIEIEYGDEKIYLTPHKFHVTFLKHCHKRGDFVVIWSKNGHQYAEQVVKKLNLSKYVHLIMSKPSRHVDDKKDLSSIVGDCIYLPFEE